MSNVIKGVMKDIYELKYGNYSIFSIFTVCVGYIIFIHNAFFESV